MLRWEAEAVFDVFQAKKKKRKAKKKKVLIFFCDASLGLFSTPPLHRERGGGNK